MKFAQAKLIYDTAFGVEQLDGENWKHTAASALAEAFGGTLYVIASNNDAFHKAQRAKTVAFLRELADTIEKDQP